MDPNQNNEYEQHLHDYDDGEHEKIDLDDIKGKIFIGGLSWQTSEANLRYYFEKFGELSDVALMVDKRTGKPRGFGFIKMKDPSAADVVMSTEHTIDGRLVDVKRALPRDKAPGPTRSESCKIFVGGLAPEITEKEFGDYFSKFGVVKDAVVMVDRNTGSSRGFGFVTFEVEETVDQVMKVQHEIMGKYVEIKRAEPRDSAELRTAGGYDNSGGMYGGGAIGGGYSGRGMGGGRGAGMNARYGAPPPRGMAGDPYAGGGYGGYGGGMRGPPPPAYNRYPSAPGGYGGAPYGRGAPGYGGMAPAAGYGGYATQSPPQNMGSYYGGALSAPTTGYSGYGSSTSPQPVSGYGGAFGSRGGADEYGQGADYRAPAQGYDNSAIAAGYANAAAMQMRAQPTYTYGGPGVTTSAASYSSTTVATSGGYGGAAYAYGGTSAVSPTNAAPRSEEADPYDTQNNYGAYRGPDAGRADRSYRPY